MSAVAVVLQDKVVLQGQDARLHPVPRGALRDDSGRLLTRSTLISVLLHLSLVAIALAINYWPRSEVIGTPVETVMDVSIIPLSALETLLPKGAPVPPAPQVTEPEAPAPPPQKPDEVRPTVDVNKKIVMPTKRAPKPSAKVTAPQKQATDASSQASSATASQPLGVANGEAASLEQARISYQDMVATLLARAKRYPERALKRRMTGEGSIRLEISQDGSLASFQIIRSTEMPILDDELRAMVDRAAPFPAFPNDLRKNRLALVVPIAFRLES